MDPSHNPTAEPSEVPTVVSSHNPTVEPSEVPTVVSSHNPTVEPSEVPTVVPLSSKNPIELPSQVVQNYTTLIPSLQDETRTQSTKPTISPTKDTNLNVLSSQPSSRPFIINSKIPLSSSPTLVSSGQPILGFPMVDERTNLGKKDIIQYELFYILLPIISIITFIGLTILVCFCKARVNASI
jgi:hypothetical protein